MPLLSYTVPQQPVLSQQSFFPQQSIISQQSIAIQQSIINQPKTFSHIQFQSFNMRNAASLLALLTSVVPALTAPAVSEAQAKSTCNQFGSVQAGPYTVNPDKWGEAKAPARSAHKSTISTEINWLGARRGPGRITPTTSKAPRMPYLARPLAKN